MAKEDKTNVMRLLENAGIALIERKYDPSITDGMLVAKTVGTDPSATFKTLVTVSDRGKNYVFVIPVCEELDLKLCAKAVSEKSISMLPQKFLLPLTGYVHGGCSPVGMKKKLQTLFHVSCLDFDQITLSAGKVGRQITINPKDLLDYFGSTTAFFVPIKR